MDLNMDFPKNFDGYYYFKFFDILVQSVLLLINLVLFWRVFGTYLPGNEYILSLEILKNFYFAGLLCLVLSILVNKNSNLPKSESRVFFSKWTWRIVILSLFYNPFLILILWSFLFWYLIQSLEELSSKNLEKNLKLN